MENYRPLQGMPEVRRVGLMGGTFDPIHFGHLVVAEEVRAALDLHEMVFIPAGQPPHKVGKTVTAVEHRLGMLKLAIASNPYFSISDVDIRRSGPSYTVETLRLLREEWGTRGTRRIQTALYFVIGWDSLEELTTWHDPEGILEQLTYLVAVQRPGYEETPEYRERLERQLPAIRSRLLIMPAPQLDISATDLRQRVAEHRPIMYQTPDAVGRYIAEHKLYQHMEEGSRTDDTTTVRGR